MRTKSDPKTSLELAPIRFRNCTKVSTPLPRTQFYYPGPSFSGVAAL
jgi:hypothetical protein